MPSSYTPLLRLTLPADGELVGTWGQTVKNGITSLEEAAIAGTASVVLVDADYVMTIANGAADVARNAVVRFTGALTAQRNIIVPSSSKTYIIRNNTTGGFGLNIKTAAGTGVVVPAGQAMLVYCDGVNVMQAIDAIGAGKFADGSLAAPSIAFAAATNTGFHRQANTTIGVGVGGTLAASFGVTEQRFLSNGVSNLNLMGVGYLGLGTENFNLFAAGRAIFAIQGSTLSGVEFQTTGNTLQGQISVDTGGIFSIVASGMFTLGTNGAERLQVTPVGALLLGVSSNPNNRLAIFGGRADASLFLKSNVATGGAGNSTLYFANSVSEAQGYVNYDHSANFLSFGNIGERMRINNQGQVSINTTLPGGTLRVNGSSGLGMLVDTVFSFSDTNVAIKINGDTNTPGGYIQQTPASGGLALSAGCTYYGSGAWKTDSNVTAAGGTSIISCEVDGKIRFRTNTGVGPSTQFTPADRMWIDQQGNVYINKAGPSNASGGASRLSASSTLGSGDCAIYVDQFGDGQGYGIQSRLSGGASGSAGWHHICYNSAAAGIGGMYQNSNTTMTFATASDYRLKDAISDLDDSGTFIDALRPRLFNWKDGGARAAGFIAHEFAEVSPSSVSGEKDGEQMQMLDASTPEVMANIIAELQSLRQRVVALGG